MDVMRAERGLECSLTGWVEYLPGWYLPPEFIVTWNDGGDIVVAMTVLVGADGRPRCHEVRVTGTGEQPVTGTEIRAIPVATFLDDAVALAVRRVPERKPLKLFKSSEEFRAARELQRRHRERERWQLTPEHLREVLRVYDLAGGADGIGVAEVARHFDKPRATASRWVQKAKAEVGRDEVKSKGAKKRPRKGTR